MEANDKLIEITVTPNYDDYLKYFRFSLFRGKLYKIGPKLFFIISIFGISLSLFTGLNYGFDTMDITVLVILVLLMLLIIFLMFIYPKIYYKSIKKFVEGTTKYSFTEDYMFAESTSDSSTGTSKMKYDALYRVYELQDFFYIFISSSQAFLITKRSCSAEDAAGLRKLLQAKVKKYYNYSKEK